MKKRTNWIFLVLLFCIFFNINNADATKPVCTENDWQSLTSPFVCPVNGHQTQTWIKIGSCEGGVNKTASVNISCNNETCLSFNYSSWSECSLSGTQTRTVLSMNPNGCTGGNPIINQECINVPACKESDWNYTISPLVCPNESKQVKKWNLVGHCKGGIIKPEEENISCNPIKSTCTIFNYSSWSECSQSQVKTRQIISKTPAGCEGGLFNLVEICDNIECKERDWMFSLSPQICGQNGKQIRHWGKIGQCEGGIYKNETEVIKCEFNNTCSSFNYSYWTECFPSGTRSRQIILANPNGCTGGNPLIYESCTYGLIEIELNDSEILKNQSDSIGNESALSLQVLKDYMGGNLYIVIIIISAIVLLLLFIIIIILRNGAKNNQTNIFLKENQSTIDLNVALKQKINDNIIILLNQGKVMLEKGDRESARQKYIEIKDIVDSNHTMVDQEEIERIVEFYNDLMKTYSFR